MAMTRNRNTRSADRATRATVTVSAEEIARRAYELFILRGGEHGCDIDDWLQAERELVPVTSKSDLG